VFVIGEWIQAQRVELNGLLIVDRHGEGFARPYCVVSRCNRASFDLVVLGAQRRREIAPSQSYEHFMELFRWITALPAHLAGMSLADTFRDSAADCAFLAKRAEDQDMKHALMRMEAAWRTLANQQEILDCKRWKKPLG
jgi:hypothetical protein